MPISGRAGAAPAFEPQEAHAPARSTASAGYPTGRPLKSMTRILPLKLEAGRESLSMAPAVPRVTPVLIVRSDAPAQSYDTVEDESSSGQ